MTLECKTLPDTLSKSLEIAGDHRRSQRLQRNSAYGSLCPLNVFILHINGHGTIDVCLPANIINIRGSPTNIGLL